VVYVFALEDGRLESAQTKHCDAVVDIPAFHCLNVATAVSAVLWDRTYKLWRDHGVAPPEFVEG
jgi:tRNA C32,U32 (ribose-2'-O)-methylase TrmJ